MKLTKEQQAIIDNISSKNNTTIKAFAGCAKTTTLYEIARKFRSKRILYLCFNKSLKLEAERKFQNNVKCFNTHSLAWKEEGWKYTKKLGNPSIQSIAKICGLQKNGKPNLTDCFDVRETVNSFIISTNSEITLDNAKHSKSPTKILEHSKKYWEAMKNPDNLAASMSHDGYFKLYQLSTPSLSDDYDIILFDEGQDAHPPTLEILNNQSIPIVAVGDPYQQIYSFRGTVDSLNYLSDADSFQLSKSFRFGDNLALMNSKFLNKFYKTNHRIIGTDNNVRITTEDLSDLPQTFIYRSNYCLFEDALDFSQDFDIHFLGGFSSYNTQKILDIFNIYCKNNKYVRDSDLKEFTSFGELCSFYAESKDVEISSCINIVKKFGHQTFNVIKDLEKKEVSLKKAEVVLTTAHKAKGLEFSTVVINRDFDSFFMKNPEEVNLLYVAMTRAKNNLILDDKIYSKLKEQNCL